MKTPWFVLFGAFAWAGAFLSTAAGVEAPVRSITANGVATQEFAPDRVELAVEIKVLSDSLQTSREAVDAAHEELIRVLKRVGVPEKEVGLKRRTMRRESEWEDGRYVFLGFSCTESIEVNVRKLDTLTAVTEAMAGIEELALEGMRFRSAKEGEARREALLQAADAARQKADALAKNAGVKITALLELQETPAGYHSANIYGNFSGGADAEAGVANQSVRVEVTARYAIE